MGSDGIAVLNSIHHVSRKKRKSGAGLSRIVLHVIISNAILVARTYEFERGSYHIPYTRALPNAFKLCCVVHFFQHCALMSHAAGKAMPCINSDADRMLNHTAQDLSELHASNPSLYFVMIFCILQIGYLQQKSKVCSQKCAVYTL